MIPMNMQPDPFSVRMVFFRVGWMDHYQGITENDTISSGGAYIAQHGFGHEIFNFQPFQGAMYGYVQPPSRRDRWNAAKINLARLGAMADHRSIPNVLVVWVATSPLGGAFLVGWYKNATLYRDWQSPPSASARRYSDMDCGYYVTATSEDVVLLPPDERVFSIPQKGKGNFGQSNIWYADDHEVNQQLRLNVLQYIESRQLPRVPNPQVSAPRQPDPYRRQQVERIAVEMTVAYFTRLSYRVDSVEQDNLGWDLNAVLGNRHLRLEVKGLSGAQLVVELTANEYAAAKNYKESYRVCVVANALTEPHLEIFAYSQDSKRWESSGLKVLNIQEIISARCSAV